LYSIYVKRLQPLPGAVNLLPDVLDAGTGMIRPSLIRLPRRDAEDR